MNLRAKRAFDLVISVPLALLALPVLAVSALLLAIECRHVPIFRQRREGHRGQFMFWKLRTLPTNTPRYSLKDEVREIELGPVSRYLRKSHLDELPQIFHVVLGQMSLVGPRPKMPAEYEPVHPEYERMRLQVPQGCTGTWQIGDHKDGLPSDSPQYDEFYIAQGTLRMDVWILYRTVLLLTGIGSERRLDQIPVWTLRDPSHSVTTGLHESLPDKATLAPGRAGASEFKTREERKKIKNLVIVSPTFAPETFGTPLYVSDLARWFHHHGVNVTVLTNQPYYPHFKLFDGYGRKRRRDEVDGIKVYRLPTIVPRGGAPHWRVLSEVNFLLQGLIAALFGRFIHVDTVLSVSPGTPMVPMVGRAVARSSRHAVLVHDVQTSLAKQVGGVLGKLHPALARLERSGLGGADILFTLSEQMSDGIRELGIDGEMEVAPLWITTGDENAHYTPVGLPDDFTIVYSGSLGRKQGIDQLLDVAEACAAKRMDVRFVIRGAGPRSGELKQEIAERRLTETVEMQPPVDEDALADVLRTASLHVVPQTPGLEASVVPSKVINAMASGRPVLVMASDDSPLADLARDTDGVLAVPMGAVDQAVAAIDALRGQPDECARRGKEAADYVSSHHSRDVVARSLAERILAVESDVFPRREVETEASSEPLAVSELEPSARNAS